MKKNKKTASFLVLLLLLLLSVVYAATLGSSELSAKDSIRILMAGLPGMGEFPSRAGIGEVYQKIVWQIRMPRILLAALSGMGLSMVGAVFQGLFRNPLADPHILGVSSGAAAGATIAILVGAGVSLPGLGLISTFAFLGALGTVFAVYHIACVGNRVPVVNILLTGTAVSTLLSSGISLLMAFHHDKIEKVYLWTLGSFSAATWEKVGFLAVFTLVCTVLLLLFSRELDVLSTGTDVAESLGIDAGRVRKRLLLVTALLVAAIVSVSGIIGFVGLVIPHCVRMISGPRHKYLLPFSALSGAVFMILCDTIARNVAAPTEIPVGVITALLGTPYFIYLLSRNKKEVLS